MNANPEGETDETEKINASLAQISSGDFLDFGNDSVTIAMAFLRAFEVPADVRGPWDIELLSLVSYRSDASGSGTYSARTRGDWKLILTKNFIKDTMNIDRKLQGRVYEALVGLAVDPMTPRGDTCKPLTGEKAGMWRIRLGDTRLIYQPDPSEVTVHCLSLAARGGAYG